MEAVLAEAVELGLLDDVAVVSMRRAVALETFEEDHYVKLWRERCNMEKHSRLPLHERVAAAAPAGTESELRLPPGHLAVRAWQRRTLAFAAASRGPAAKGGAC